MPRTPPHRKTNAMASQTSGVILVTGKKIIYISADNGLAPKNLKLNKGL
jgi:hypothetical protein